MVERGGGGGERGDGGGAVGESQWENVYGIRFTKSKPFHSFTLLAQFEDLQGTSLLLGDDPAGYACSLDSAVFR
jgi:hypothetical protein